MKLVLACASIIILICPAFAEPITVVTEEWPPYSYLEEGKVKGVATDLVRAILDESGLEYTISLYPWARAYDMALNKKNILLYSTVRLPSRENLFHWVPMDSLSANFYLYSPSDRALKVKTLEQAKAYKIAVTRETASHHFLLSKGFEEGKNLILFNREKQISLMVGSVFREVDFSPRDAWYQAWWQIRSGYPHGYWVRSVFLFKKDLYMALSKQTELETVEAVRRAMEKLRKDGVLKAIMEKNMQELGMTPF